MRTFLKILAAVLLCCGASHAQVAVTGNLQNLAGANATSPTTYVQFTLQNYGSSIPTITGTTTFVNPTPPNYVPNGSGDISGSIEPNDLISPGGTYYQVCVFFQGISQWCQNYIILTSDNPWNLNTAVPVVVPPSQATNVLYAQTFTCSVGTVALSWTCSHNFGTQNVVVTCYDTSHQMLFPNTLVETDVNTVTVTWTVAQAGSCVIVTAGNVSSTNALANAVITNPTGDQNIIGYNFLHNGSAIPDVGHSWTWTAAQNFAVPPAFTQASGIAPFTVTSTTVVPNLNASSVGGFTFANPGPIGSGTPSSGAFTTISATGQITSTLVSGAPFIVASNTLVANLNAALLNGATFAAPGTIGSGTPGPAEFTTITKYNGQNTVNHGIPYEVASAVTTQQTANYPSTSIFSPSVSGLFRLSVYVVVTRAATSTSTLPALSVSFTDQLTSVAVTIPITTTQSGNAIGSTLAFGSIMCDALSSATINISTASYASSGATTMGYEILYNLEEF